MSKTMFEKKISGAAMTETAVLCLVMVPVFLMVPMLGEITDLKQTTIQASRYAAWEQTVTTTGSPPTDIKARFYEDPSIELTTGQTELGPENGVNPIWGSSKGLSQNSENENTSTGKNTPLSDSMLDTANIEISFDEGGGHTFNRNISDSGVAKTFGKGIEETGKVLDFMGNVKWDIEGDGMVDAGVQLNFQKNAFLTQDLGDSSRSSCEGASAAMFACVSAHNAIMVDGWDSASNAQAEDRSRAFVPGAALGKIGDMVSYLGYIPVFKELKGLKGAFGYVDTTVLPLDRYVETYQVAR